MTCDRAHEYATMCELSSCLLLTRIESTFHSWPAHTISTQHHHDHLKFIWRHSMLPLSIITPPTTCYACVVTSQHLLFCPSLRLRDKLCCCCCCVILLLAAEFFARPNDRTDNLMHLMNEHLYDWNYGRYVEWPYAYPE